MLVLDKFSGLWVSWLLLICKMSYWLFKLSGYIFDSCAMSTLLGKTFSNINKFWTTRMTLLLLLLTRFSRVRLCATPSTAAHQAPPPLGFSRQEHWSGLPVPSPMRESESEVTQLRPALRDPMKCSLPGSSANGIFQARVLEWVAISFSNAWKWKWSHLVVSDSSRSYGLQPTRLLRPWDFPGKSTGVGCHRLLRQNFSRLKK